MSIKSLKMTIRATPSFNEVDPMKIVWHGNYLKFFERAREELFASLGYGYRAMYESGYAWPVVDVRIKYRRPWFLEQKAAVTCEIVEYENCLVTDYKIEDEKGSVLTTARITQMAYDIKTKESLLVSPLILFEKIGKPYPGDA